MRVYFSVFLVAACILPQGLAGETPLFRAPFDGNDRAVLTSGTAKEITPYTSMRGPFVPGVREQARGLGGQNRCSFFVDEGFFPAQGTLSMWVRPEDWTPATRHFVFFARLSLTEVQREYVRMILYKYWDTKELALLAQNTVGEKRHSLIRTPIDSWQQGQWHHLAVTWDERHFRPYVDGERKGEAAAVELPRQGRWEIAVGTPFPGWAYIGKERSVIDEVAVWPKALAADEIRAMQVSGAKSLSMRRLDEGPRKAVPQPIEGNLALESNGAFALASSFRNYESLYPDNLVDGNDATAWEPFDESLPQWVEVRWEVAMKVNEVVLRQREVGSVSAFSVFGWLREGWQRLGTVDARAPERDITADFQEITTDRIRVVIDQAAARQWALTTLAVRGPDQPILRQLLDGKKDATAEKVTLTQVKIEPPDPHPGEELTVEIGLRAAEKLSGDYAFLLEIGDEPRELGWSDFSIAKALTEPKTPTSQWIPGGEMILTFQVYLPQHAPDGLTSMRLRAFDRKRQANIELLDDDGTSVEEVAKIHVRRFAEKRAPFPGGARTRFDRGSAVLEVRGRKTPPAAWAFTAPSFDRYHHYSRTGIHLYHVKTHPLSYDDTEEMLQRIYRHLDQRMGALLRVDARAAFLVHLDLRPSGAWLKRNPDERLLTAFGQLGPVSLSSAMYNEGVDQFLERLFAHLRGQPYYDHIVGYLPMACGAPDSVMGGVENNLFQKDRAKLTFGDHNPQAVRDFQTWLRVKYGGCQTRLRDAWQDQNVSFDSARPKILDLAGEGVDGGVFRDPLGSAASFDYAEWLSGVMGRFYSRLIDTIKRQAERPVIVGTYYGYNVAHLRGYNSPGPWLQNNNFDLRERLQDPDWDFFAAPTPYGNRRAGTAYYTSFTCDSLRLHEKLLIGEHDHRTFVAGPTTYGRLRSDRETEAVLKRDLAGTIIDGAGYWFADWSRVGGRNGVGFFMDPGILDTIEKTRWIHEAAIERPRRSVAEIAVFTSGETMRYHDVYRAAPIYHNLIAHTLWDAMGKIGAPYDIYMLEDLSHESLRKNYKLYVFLNTFFLRPKHRRAIDGLKCDGKTLLFFYAPGYVSRETGLKVSNIEAITGIAVSKKPGKELMQYHVADTEHAITRGLPRSASCRFQPFGYAISRELHAPELAPVFAIEDAAATVLCTYPDDTTAVAVKEMPRWRSVYSAVPRMDSTLLRGLARYAGVHLYCDRDLVMKVDNRLVMVHNGYEGKLQFEISLPGENRVEDAYTGELITSNGKSFSVSLPKVTTRLYWLHPPQEAKRR